MTTGRELCGAIMMGGGGWTTCAREPDHKGSHLEAPGTWHSVNKTKVQDMGE